MKSFKKLAALALAGIMSVTVFAVSSLAAFNTTADIITRWDETGTYLIATVVTNDAAGAVKGTLTYTNATIAEDKIVVIEEGVDAKDTYKLGDNSVTFAVTAENLDKGDTVWAEFYFTPEAGKTVELDLIETQACDIGENLDTDGINVADADVTISATATKGLGSQFRDSDDNAEDAIRFGARIDRNKSSGKTMITVGEKQYPAYFCGFLWAWSDLYKGDNLSAQVNASTGKVISSEKSINVVETTACKENADDYLIYTLALKGFYDKSGNELKDGEKSLMDIPFKATQYVVYKNTDTNQFEILFSNTMEKSYRKVMTDANSISPNVYK